MFSTRITHPTFYNRLPQLALVTSLTVLLGSCGGGSSDGNSSSSLSITGSVSTSDFPISQGEDGWSRVAQWLGFKSVHAQAINEVDTLVAIPSDHGNIDIGVYGNIKSTSLNADGSFDLTLTKEYDWVLLLVNSKALTLDQKVVAYVTIPASVAVAEDGSLIDLPFSAATSDAIDIGKISAVPGDARAAQSDKDAQTIEASVSLSLDDLKQYAKADDAYRHLANVYLNYAATSGEFYFPHVEWRWQGNANLDTLGNTQTAANDFSAPSVFTEIETNSQAMSFNDLCNADITLGLFPPQNLTINGTEFTSANGMMNANMASGNSGYDYCFNSNLGIQTTDSNASTLAFQFPLAQSDGMWKLKADDTTIAAFDFALSSPLDDNGKPLNFGPLIRIQRDGDRVLSVDIQWQQFSSAGYYVPVNDNALTDALVANSFINLIDYSRAAKGQDVNFIKNDEKGLISGNTPISGDYDWYLGSTVSDPNNGVAHISELSISYSQAGISYRFSWIEQST